MSEKSEKNDKLDIKKNLLKKKSSKLNFQNDFYSDLNFSDTLYALIIRSPTKKGIIRSISLPDIPDGYYLFTARDVPGANIMDTPLGKVPIFSEGNVSYLGEPLGILVGPDQLTLKHLQEQVDIIFDTTPIEQYFDHIKDETNGKKVHSQELFSPKLAERSIQWGPCFSKRTAKGKSPMDKVFEKCSTVLSDSYTYSLNPAEYSEPNGAICSFDGEDLIVYTPTIWITNLRNTLCQALQIKSDNILINKTKNLSSTTNAVWYNSIIVTQVAVAALKTKKTVKLMYSRIEQNAFMNTIQPLTITHKTGINKDGKLLAMQVDIDVDAGAYNPFSQEILDRLIIATAGLYKTENLSITANAFASQNPPSSIDLQLIDSGAFFAFENHMTKICTKAQHINPMEFRKENFHIHNRKEKNTWPFNINVTNLDKCLDTLKKESDFERKWSAYNLSSKNRHINFSSLETQNFNLSPLRGIGLSCAFEGSGYYGSEVYGNEEYIETTLETDHSVTIHSSPVSPSIQEIWKELVSNLMGIKNSQVKINSFFNQEEEPPLPEIVYNNISVMTELLTKCCDGMKHLKEGQTLPYTVRRKVSAQRKNEWNMETFSGTPFHDTSTAAATVELEVDPYTFRERIRNIILVLSCGRILNRKAAEKTVRLSVEKVLSSLVKNDTIKVENLQIIFMESDDNPAKLGELIYNIIPASYTQALSQALNCSINRIPIETKTIYNTISDKNKIHSVQKKSKNEKEKLIEKNSGKNKESYEVVKADENTGNS